MLNDTIDSVKKFQEQSDELLNMGNYLVNESKKLIKYKNMWEAYKSWAKDNDFRTYQVMVTLEDQVLNEQ